MTDPGRVNFQELAAACAVMAAIIGLATAYLRLYMAKAIHEMRDSITESMGLNFVFKAAHRPEMHEIKKELVRHEARIEKLSDRVDVVEIRQARIQ